MKYEIITYSRSTGDITHSKRLYSTRWKPKPPYNVKCLYYMPTRRKVDKTNLESAIMDILVDARILKDDNSSIVAATDGSRVMYDKENPRTEIFIEELEV